MKQQIQIALKIKIIWSFELKKKQFSVSKKYEKQLFYHEQRILKLVRFKKNFNN